MSLLRSVFALRRLGNVSPQLHTCTLKPAKHFAGRGFSSRATRYICSRASSAKLATAAVATATALFTAAYHKESNQLAETQRLLDQTPDVTPSHLVGPACRRAPHRKFRAGVLGATGTVGQRFIELLQQHPWFEVSKVGASQSSAGKQYGAHTRWLLGSSMPSEVAGMTIVPCAPEHFEDCDFVFSALDASVAGEIETAFASRGLPVFSNARNHRYDADVPILVPPVNADHLQLVTSQQTFKENGGFIITNANCSSTGLVIALKPLHERFGIDKMAVFTMQAISGAGYPGVASLDIIDNVVPYISGEEPKMELEPLKMLGKVTKTAEGQFTIDPAQLSITAHCNRVAVTDGHTICVSLKLNRPASLDQVKEVLRQPAASELSCLPSSPDRFIFVHDDNKVDRPQPKLDRASGHGMTTVVGRIRECPLLDVKFTLLTHNTIVGAAGGSILNAELAYHHNLLRLRQTEKQNHDSTAALFRKQ